MSTDNVPYQMALSIVTELFDELPEGADVDVKVSFSQAEDGGVAVSTDVASNLGTPSKLAQIAIMSLASSEMESMAHNVLYGKSCGEEPITEGPRPLSVLQGGRSRKNEPLND